MPTPAVRATASEAGLRTTGAENCFRRLEDTLAIADSIGARFRVLFSDCLHANVQSREGLKKRRYPPYMRQDTLTHSTRVKQTARKMKVSARRHDGIHSRSWIVRVVGGS